MADMSNIPQAVAELRSAFQTGKTKTYAWRIGQLRAFKRMMTERRKELCDAIQQDLHKSNSEAYLTECNMVEVDLQMALENLSDWMKPEKKSTNALNMPAVSYVQCEPLGVALIVGAYNYPVMLALGPLVGCIAAGNCALLKMPTPLSVPNTSKAMARLIREYLDPQCFKVVEGDREAVTAVLEERYDIIFFTGSTRLGRIVAQAAGKNLTPVILEMGGQNPCVVDESAAVDLAARRIVWGSLMNCGQTCLRPEYIFIHDKIADDFRAQVKAVIPQFYSENPQSTPWFGRLPHSEKWQAIMSILEKDRQFVDHGGIRADEADRFVEPTVLFFKDIDTYASSAAAREEIFGPIMPIIRYKDISDVISFINRREKPLAMYVFTGRQKVAEQLMASTSSGSFSVNDVLMQCTNMELPFGGVGHSGLGAYHGRLSFEAFSHRRAVLWKPNLSFLDAPIRYPPYGPWKSALLQFIQEPKPSWIISVPLKVAAVAILAAIASRMPHHRIMRAIGVLLGWE